MYIHISYKTQWRVWVEKERGRTPTAGEGGYSCNSCREEEENDGKVARGVPGEEVAAETSKHREQFTALSVIKKKIRRCP